MYLTQPILSALMLNPKNLTVVTFIIDFAKDTFTPIFIHLCKNASNLFTMSILSIDGIRKSSIQNSIPLFSGTHGSPAISREIFMDTDTALEIPSYTTNGT